MCTRRFPAPSTRARPPPPTRPAARLTALNALALPQVIGVGGGGSNAVNRMKQSDLQGVDFYVMNTDVQVGTSSPVAIVRAVGCAQTIACHALRRCCCYYARTLCCARTPL